VPDSTDPDNLFISNNYVVKLKASRQERFNGVQPLLEQQVNRVFFPIFIRGLSQW